ncbi:trigger factor [Candidatus Binatus soli]|jgi:trigger factor|uniref:trigger factor n=1 Tax=Candidatus Binatus soli TaxID=1953413 RepID=UPI003D0A32A0
MNVNIEEPSSLRRKLTIEVEPDEIKHELDRAFNELKRGVVLKGFRPGHAPRNLLERFFGDQVRGEVIQKLVKEYTDKALEEHDLKPVAAPEIVTEQSDLQKDLSLKFSATFDLRPKIEVKDYEGLKVPESKVEVSDDEVEEAIARFRERQATLKKIEDRTVVEDGDYALASVEAFEDGKPLSSTRPDDRLVEVSERALAHGVYEVLKGAELGKQMKASKSYPADYSHKDLAGKTIEWRATPKEIYRRELPAVDDDFAKDLGDENLEAFRTRVRGELLAHAKQEANARARQGLLDLVIERNPVELPESLVARELNAMEAELHQTLEAGGLSHEEAGERVKQSADDLKTRAEKRARTELIVDALAEQEKIEIDDGELGARVAAIVTQSGRNRDRAAEFYRKQENREALRQSMRREKALDFILSRAKREDAASEPK